jgi:hypothetical protein
MIGVSDLSTKQIDKLLGSNNVDQGTGTVSASTRSYNERREKICVRIDNSFKI